MWYTCFFLASPFFRATNCRKPTFFFRGFLSNGEASTIVGWGGLARYYRGLQRPNDQNGQATKIPRSSLNVPRPRLVAHCGFSRKTQLDATETSVRCLDQRDDMYVHTVRASGQQECPWPLTHDTEAAASDGDPPQRAPTAINCGDRRFVTLCFSVSSPFARPCC